MKIVSTRFFIYLLLFASIRGVMFFSPVALANLLSPAAYGVIEFSQASASLLATLLTLGVTGLVPISIIRNENSISMDSICAHQIVLSIFFAVASLAALIMQEKAVTSIVCSLTCIGFQQSLWGITLKSKNKQSSALLVDAVAWVSMLAGATFVALLLNHRNASERGPAVTLLVASIFFTVLTVWRFLPSRSQITFAAYMKMVAAGVPLMITTILTVLITTSGRIGVGILTDATLTGKFSALFRLSTIPIFFHQIIYIYFFRSLFSESMDSVARRLRDIILVVSMAAILVGLFGAQVARMWGPLFSEAFTSEQSTQLILISQSILWSAITLNDTIANRSRVLVEVGKRSFGYLLVTFPAGIAALQLLGVSLKGYAAIFAIAMLGYFINQCVSLRACGIRLMEFWFAAGFGFLIYFLVALLH